MNIKIMIISVTRLFSNSKKNIHIIVLFFTAVINVLLHITGIKIENNNKISILTGISLLCSLFLLAVECIDFKYINKKFTNMVKISSRKENKESVVIRDTVLSLSLVTFLLIGICFILAIFESEYVYLLVWIINYLFFGTIYTIILWNYTLSKQVDKEGE